VAAAEAAERKRFLHVAVDGAAAKLRRFFGDVLIA
jgi:hypothetical protein